MDLGSRTCSRESALGVGDGVTSMSLSPPLLTCPRAFLMYIFKAREMCLKSAFEIMAKQNSGHGPPLQR